MSVLIKRALSAYFGQKEDIELPAIGKCSEILSDGKKYVLIKSDNDKVLAVYRVRYDNVLKKLKRFNLEV
jgi:hypothetical protein